MKRTPTIPKWIRNDYNPSMRQWMRWLRLKRRVKTLCADGFDAMQAFFNACEKDRRLHRSGFTRYSLHSSSSSTRLEFFPWAEVTRTHHEYLGTTISLDVETHDCDTRTVAEVNYG